uniref:NACHT domain-containing protein n=1 Tax=Sphaeramia orbicularis TaxID=375764 RepID=A0A673AWD9_9TELE
MIHNKKMFDQLTLTNKPSTLLSFLFTLENLAWCRQNVKSILKRKYERIHERITQTGPKTDFDKMYTTLWIISGEAGEVNTEHEVRQIETASRNTDRPEETISCNDIFKNSADGDEPTEVRTVLTKGVAGIGKTVLTQKFCLDWANDKANQNIHFTFPFTFKQLNVLKEKKFSLVELIHHFYKQTKEAVTSIFEDNENQVVLIFDGLDECRIPLDFHKTQILTDITESASVDVLLINLIRGGLLPSTHIWITTRPAAANQIPAECVDMVTEIKGFTDDQKEEYLRKRFSTEKEANSVISHIKTLRSLHIMCHIPVFCWITATVLKKVLETRNGRWDLPRTLTEMFIHFLVVQAKLKNVKYGGRSERDSAWNPDTMKMIESLGKLAFKQLQKGNLIFYESDLTECGIDIEAATCYSGVFTEIFKVESGLYEDTVFCFVHLTVQEFLAALHVYLTFINTGVNLLSEEQTTSQSSESAETTFYQTAVDKALQSPNGHLDLFLRFLLGLSLQTNQSLLRGLLKRTGSSTKTNWETAEHIKKKISENLSAERSINLFHCLNELNDHSLVDQIQHYLSSGHIDTKTLSPAQWSALVFILLSSEKDLDVFDLRKYSASKEALIRMLPVVKASKKALGCNLSETSCEALSSVLSSESSNIRQLDLSNNELPDSGVSFLCDGLKKTTCTLEELSLSGCYLTDSGCKSLASVISHKLSSLRVLDLSNNDLTDSGVRSLSDGMKSTNCTLETLRANTNFPCMITFNLKASVLECICFFRLTGCNLSQRSCEVLSSVLSSVSCTLRHLDLSNNDLKDSGVGILSDGLKSTHCGLETLRSSTILIFDFFFSHTDLKKIKYCI